MAGKLDLEARMTIKVLDQKGCSKSSMAKQLGVTEGAVRYHLRRQREGATDGRSRQAFRAESLRHVIGEWVESLKEQEEPVNLADLHYHLVEEYKYEGSLRSVERFYRAHYPKPARRARRRVETPPGSQAQVDWAEFRDLMIGGECKTAFALHMALSHSRYDAVVWSERKDQLAWQHAHNEALRRLDGVPATLRVDNEKTAVSRGAGAWGEINPAYRSYALAVRFPVDACPPRSPHFKGKVERRIRDQRLGADPRKRHWNDLGELQEWTDQRMMISARRRTCPATGTSVYAAWQAEKRWLAPLSILPEPFDVAVTRPVSADCLVWFEGRQYAVPFPFMGKRVEVRGCAGRVQILGGGHVILVYPRHTPEQILIDPRCYQGEATEDVLPPTPLGRMGRRLQEIAAMEPEKRPVDLYAALAEVAR